MAGDDDGQFLLNVSSEITTTDKKLKDDRVRQQGSFGAQKSSKVLRISQSNKKKLLQNKEGKKQEHENFRSSSLFQSNPEIPVLRTSKASGKHEPLFSKKSFSDLNIHPHLVSCLQSRLNIINLTEVQQKTIPVCLEKKDTLVKSCTGSGKTLTYAVPIVQTLQEKRPKIQRSDGLFALIIVPTRELAIQVYECFSTLTKAFTWIVPGFLMGGARKKSEKARIRKGLNILVSTPGRLLDHLETTTNLHLNKIEWLVIDEADKLLEQGFENAVLRIVNQCQKERQTILLSATLSKGVENLAGMSMVDPVCIDASSETDELLNLDELVVPANLKQHVLIVPSKLRLIALSCFILDKCMKGNFKALVFMCTQGSVDFHYTLLVSVLAPILKSKSHKCKFFKLHGSMKQDERLAIFNKFRNAKEGILLCTDVAARGWDLPHVDWIVQYSAPASLENYVHRVGRTARIGQKGYSLLFLLPSEDNFFQLLQEHSIQLREIAIENLLQMLLLIADVLETDCKKILGAEVYAKTLQTKYETMTYSEKTLHESAIEAFTSYIQCYSSYPKNIRSALPFKMLHLGHVAKSFCLQETPAVLGVKSSQFHQSNHSRQSTIHDFKTKHREPVKRKRITRISEFDSGRDAMADGRKPYKKKKKN